MMQWTVAGLGLARRQRVLEVTMTKLRIFSYLPNPRVWKATIAARFCGVELEIRGAPADEMKSWLWDYDARPLAEGEADASIARVGRTGLTGAQLFKTDAFLQAQPFGNVPAAFAPDGKTGIFESNSIMRAVARLGQSRFPLYGRDYFEASRIDSFLDVSLVFARDSQIYLLSLMDGTIDEAIQARARDAFAIYASGIEQALSSGRHVLVGEDIPFRHLLRDRVRAVHERASARGQAEDSRAGKDPAPARRSRLSAHDRPLCPAAAT
jgi:glutathione S-transferase